MPKTKDNPCKQCRAAGKKLMLKGKKCEGPNCTLVSRNYPPGIHGGKRRRGKMSQYKEQLLEKQKAKRLYGMRERQFRLFFTRAGKKGDAGLNLLKMLEMRLDNVIYRLGFAVSRAQARQMVSHSMFLVNGKKMNIPSYQVEAGDIIEVKKTKQQKKVFENWQDKLQKNDIPGWLNYDRKEEKAKVLHEPAADQVDQSINYKAIVEFYSK